MKPEMLKVADQDLKPVQHGPYQVFPDTRHVVLPHNPEGVILSVAELRLLLSLTPDVVVTTRELIAKYFHLDMPSYRDYSKRAWYSEHSVIRTGILSLRKKVDEKINRDYRYIQTYPGGYLLVSDGQIYLRFRPDRAVVIGQIEVDFEHLTARRNGGEVRRITRGELRFLLSLSEEDFTPVTSSLDYITRQTTDSYRYSAYDHYVTLTRLSLEGLSGEEFVIPDITGDTVIRFLVCMIRKKFGYDVIESRKKVGLRLKPNEGDSEIY